MTSMAGEDGNRGVLLALAPSFRYKHQRQDVLPFVSMLSLIASFAQRVSRFTFSSEILLRKTCV